jgi:MFS family permease
LYYVRQANLPDISIAYITMANTVAMVVGYFFWLRFSRIRGSRPILLWTTLGISLFPIFVALTTNSAVMILLAAGAGLFNAGLNLVFFDELMRSIPVDQSPSFVAFAQTSQYLTTMISPLVSAWLAQMFGLSAALVIAGMIQLLGFFLFTRQ